jgi:AcrR family transcriptional regulator
MSAGRLLKRIVRVSQTEALAKTEVMQTNRPNAARFPAGSDPAKRDQILDGAQRVFLLMGFDAAGMADITREAGVSKGTIYVYFDGKEELFVALMDRERDRMFRDITAALDGPGDAMERLHTYGLTLTGLLCSDAVIQAHRIVIGISGRKPAMGVALYEKGARRGVALLGKFIETEIAAGSIQPCDSERAAQQFIELCLAGLFRQRLLAYLPEPPSAEQIGANVAAALYVFQAAYMVRRE